MALPTVRQLEYFLTAARLGTFAAAAAAQHVAQPSLSEQIRELEKTLGLPLFTRTSRKLLLTDAGKQLLPLAEKVLAGISEMVETSNRIQSIDQGTVTFGTFNSAHLYLLTDLIRDFRAQHPGVRIRVIGLNSAEVADLVRDGEIEAGIVQLPIDDRELTVSSSAFSDQVVYVTRYRENAQRAVDIGTLAERKLILSEARWSQDDPLRASLLARAQSAGVVLEPIVEVEFQTHALELAAQGIGDSLVSFHVGHSMIARRGLFWAPLDPPVVETFAFITRRSGAISPATAEFIRYAQRILTRIQAAAPKPPGP